MTVCQWVEAVRTADIDAVVRMARGKPEHTADYVLALAPPDRRGVRGLTYDPELQRAYFLHHAENDVLTCVTFEGIKTPEMAERLYREIEAAWPVTVDGLLSLQDQVTGRRVKKIELQ